MVALLAGFFLSLVGSLPPGIISLTVAQVSIRRGMFFALLWASGAAVAEFFQAFVAVVLADWFSSLPMFEKSFKMAGAPVFLALAVYFLFFAKVGEQKVEPEVKPGPEFLKGMALGFFNLLALPYWVFYCGVLHAEDWIDGSWSDAILLSFGVSVGTVAALFGYAWLGKRILEHSREAAVWANRITGLIFLVLGLNMVWDGWF